MQSPLNALRFNDSLGGALHKDAMLIVIFFRWLLA
jgi:hypothetical protein